MNREFYDDHVRDALRELSDAEWQERVWRGLEPDVVSDFGEAMLFLFSDSGLEDALAAGDAYGTPIDGQLRRIAELADQIGYRTGVEQVLRDPRLREVRAIATSVLDSLHDRPLGTVAGQPLGPAQ